MSRRARRIAIIAPPTVGHFSPLQALGAELVGAGHEVAFVHTAGAAKYISDPALSFVPLTDSGLPDRLLDSYLAKLANPTGGRGLTRMIAATADMTGRLLDGAPAAIRKLNADALVADSAEPAGALIAAHLGIPHVVSVTGLPLIQEESVPPPFLGWRYRPDRLGRFRNRGGYFVSGLLMRPISKVIEQRREAWGISADARPLAYVAQCPQSLDYPREHLPDSFHYGGPWRARSRQSVDLPLGPRPLIFCSLGSLQGSRKALFASMAQACADIGARAVIGHGGGLSADEEAALPGQPLVRPFWPQREVLRHCAAAILHGGFNTVLDALAAEVPIIAVPIAFEQPGTAARLARSGVGQVIPYRKATPRRLARALQEVISDGCYRDAASLIAADMKRSGGAASAAGVISAALANQP